MASNLTVIKVGGLDPQGQREAVPVHDQWIFDPFLP